MIKHIRLLTPLALLVILALALSGCAAGQQVTAADVVAKMRETMKSTQTAQGTTDLAVNINKDGLRALAQTLMGGNAGQPGGKDPFANLPDSASATIHTWKQSPDKMLDKAPAEL